MNCLRPGCDKPKLTGARSSYCSRSCAHKRHGMTGTPEHVAWRSMLQRCHNPKALEWPNYGARGITVCAAWRASFEAFLASIGPRPGRGYSIDRIDNDGHYRPGNVRWANRTVQARNMRRNVRITIDGQVKTASEWGELYGRSSFTIAGRIRRGWAPAKAVLIPDGRAKLTPTQVVEIRAQKGAIKSRDLARQYGVSKMTIAAIWRGLTWRLR